MNEAVTIDYETEVGVGPHRGEVKAVVLAGGLGTARCSVMDTYSSLLFPMLDGQPLLNHLLHQLRGHGIREVAVSLSADGGRGDRLIDAVSRIPPSEMTVHWQIDSGNRGAAGALKELEGFLSSGPALVLHPSVWLEGFETRRHVEGASREGLYGHHAARVAAQKPERLAQRGPGCGRRGETVLEHTCIA